MERLRAYGAARGLDGQGRLKRALLRLAMTVTWPVTTFFDAFGLARQGDVLGRPGAFRTFAVLYGAALMRNAPPLQYVKFHTPHEAGEDPLADYLFPMDVRAFDALNRQRGAPGADVQDKQRFAAICAQHDLPCVETIATFRGGALIEGGLPPPSRQIPLFVKALSGKAGEGAEIWTSDGESYLAADGRRLSADELTELFRARDCIVQPFLRDCQVLRPFGSGALSCLRIVTVMTVNGRVVPFTVCLNLATDTGASTSHHGILCAVDLHSGALTKTYSGSEPQEADRADQIDEDDLIGLVLPHWPATLRLVADAHQKAFPAFVTLGWDVAVTDDGPVLLETNQGWGMSQHQVLDGGLGQTFLGEAIDDILEAQGRG